MFCDELKKARLSAYLTQKRLSELTHIPLSNIKNWERGNYLPSANSWNILYEFLKPRVLTNDMKNCYLAEKTRGKNK